MGEMKIPLIFQSLLNFFCAKWKSFLFHGKTFFWWTAPKQRLVLDRSRSSILFPEFFGPSPPSWPPNALFLPPLLETKKCWHDVNCTHTIINCAVIITLSSQYWPFCCGMSSYGFHFCLQLALVHSSNLEGGCHLKHRDGSLQRPIPLAIVH